MPHASYIEAEAIPVQASQRAAAGGVARAVELLEGARVSNKVLRLEMTEEDRGGTWYYRIKQAAKRLDIAIDMRCEYRRREGLVKPEASVIYVIIQDSSPVAPVRRAPSPLGLNIVTPPERRIVDAVGAEISR